MGAACTVLRPNGDNWEANKDPQKRLMSQSEMLLVEMLCGRTKCWKELTLAAVQRDSPSACACLAVAYAGGNGPKNLTVSKVFADKSLPWLQHRLASIDPDGGNVDPFATVMIGLFHQYGIGEYQGGYEEAHRCFMSVRNDSIALFCASKLVSSAEFSDRSPDFVQTFQYLSDAANLGLGYAQYELGRAYENGIGTGSNLEEAKKWYQRAIKMGIRAAATDVERCESKMTKRSSQEATIHSFVYLFTQVLCGKQAALQKLQTIAIRDKNPVAQACMSILLNSQYPLRSYKRSVVPNSDDGLASALKKASLPWLRKHAAAGCLIATTFLGILLLGDWNTKDEGEKFTLKSANNGCPLAQVVMGEASLWRSTPLSTKIDFLERAAAQKHPLAEYELAQLYLRGEGVTASRQKYEELMKLAADHGFNKP